MPRRWHQIGDDASHHTDDGDNKARSPGRARNKPLKPLRRECRRAPVHLWRLTRVLSTFAHGAAGAAAHPAFPAPSLPSWVFWANASCNPGAIRAAGRLACIFSSLKFESTICMGVRSKQSNGRYRRNGSALPLPLWERAGVRGPGLSLGLNPSPGSHLRCNPTSPTRGEVIEPAARAARLRRAPSRLR
ncbi:hypothetical protein SAMN05444158_5518 [Bradyrhizobium canariense]|uniref:Uncharacterized protein n=1 Tax=Bradyrhizobium canariense TaxID=255045 RepID=A0A1H1ZKU2_9BRAD|nr:hypothetical protein SAMN05444158_5518 [Bradyrhizobium canariense]